MAKEKLNDYIRKCIELGKEKEEITNNLLSVGWSAEDIDEAFSSLIEEDVPVPDVPEEEDSSPLSQSVDDFSNSLNNEINSIQEENNLNNQQSQEDPFREPIIKEQSEEPQENSFVEKPIQEENQEPIIIEEKSEDKFVDSSKKIDAKKIVIPVVAILIAVLLFVTVFAFIQKSGPFSFLKEEPEIISEEENIIPPQEEIIVEEPIVSWACGDQLVDERDGNIYPTVQIGSQCFMTKNLNYYMEGASYYNNDVASYGSDGLLYDWNTAVSACPLGWSLPSDADFKMLERYLGMEEEEIDTTGWREVSPNAQGTLESLNIALSGAKEISGEFKYQGEYANFWLSGSVDDLYSMRAFRAKDSNIYRGNASGEYGYSVRCVRY